MDPREYQNTAVENIANSFETMRSVLLCSPVGSGKTYIAGLFLQRHLTGTCLFIVNRQTLVSQAYEEFLPLKLRPAVVHNTLKNTPSGIRMNTDVNNSNVIITLVESFDNMLSELPIDINPSIIVMDEAHKATSETFQELRDKYPNSLILGLSATPGRKKNKEGEALSDWYETMVTTLTVEELIAQGYLAKPRYCQYNSDDHIVNKWMAEVRGEKNRRTIVFTTDTRHSLALKESFLENGIVAEIITSGSTMSEIKDLVTAQTPNQKNAIFNAFHAGKIEVLISVNALCEGFDEKLAKYCVLARSVGNIALLHQMMGRVLRSHPDKDEGVIMDFHGNLDKYGPIESYVWELDGSGSQTVYICQNNETVHFGVMRRKKIFVCCDNCSHVYDAINYMQCSNCGQKNSVRVSAELSDLRDDFIERIGEKEWKHFSTSPFVKTKDAFWEMVNIIRRVAGNVNMQDKFNVQYFNLFSEDGDFKQEFSWLKSLLANKKKVNMTDKIEFNI